ncbi:MAG TPA: matrixin family metalloprotease [Gemmatimonadales bacterium]|jgi:hypothetical protein
MRRFGIPVLAWGAVVLLAAACKESTVSECIQSNATAYAVHLPGDTGATFNWPMSFQPVRYYADPTGALPANVDSGLTLWTNAFRCNELALQRTTDSTQADVIIRNPAFLPPAVGIAELHADSTTACTGKTVVFVDSSTTPPQLTRPIRSYVSPLGTDSAATNSCYHFVTAHEIGHTLGLFAHSPNAADLMYQTPQRPGLSINDKLTVQLLYHLSHVGIVPQPR